MIDAIHDAGIKRVYALSNCDLPADFLENGILLLESSTDLEECEDHKEGDISGISASNIPTWLKGFINPEKKWYKKIIGTEKWKKSPKKTPIGISEP